MAAMPDCPCFASVRADWQDRHGDREHIAKCWLALASRRHLDWGCMEMLKLHNKKSLLGMTLVLSVGCGGIAAAEQFPAPGEYIYKGGNGSLRVTRAAHNTLHFEISTVGGNGHICDLDGDIKNARSVVSDDEEGRCELSFTPLQNGGVSVSMSDASACQVFCGMRAGYDGDYLRSPQGCSYAERKQRRDAFSTLYRSKHYDQAAPILEDMLARCKNVVDGVEDTEIRNDLAITQYHLGRAADCIRTLEPTLAYRIKSAAALENELAPADFETYLPLAKATWHNLKLCKKTR